MSNRIRPKRALLSVYDKTDLLPLAQALCTHHIELVATGGTYRMLKDAGLPVMSVEAITGFPEILEGRLKTLQPALLGGILAKRPQHEAEAASHRLSLIDVVVCNLYPFVETIQKPGVTLDDAVEQMDIGGPTMLRAAAKNMASVTVLSDPLDYPLLISELEEGICFETRQHLAQKAFAHTAAYDEAIAKYLEGQCTTTEALRYGENPHQQATLLKPNPPPFEVFQGKALSYNNLVDADCAYRLVHTLDAPACVVVKHDAPCGVAVASTLLDAYQRAFEADAESAFGGVIAFNRWVDASTMAFLLQQQFVEVIVAPGFEEHALQAAHDRPKVRLVQLHRLQEARVLKTTLFGTLSQTPDVPEPLTLHWVTEKRADDQVEDLMVAYRVAHFAKSNAIVLVQEGRTIGIGQGQTSRIFAFRSALWRADQARFDTHGAVLASDGFFPFPDSIQLAHESGITAIIQPGGSIRDQEVIDCANALGIAMACTRIRHFRH